MLNFFLFTIYPFLGVVGRRLNVEEIVLYCYEFKIISCLFYLFIPSAPLFKISFKRSILFFLLSRKQDFGPTNYTSGTGNIFASLLSHSLLAKSLL